MDDLADIREREPGRGRERFQPLQRATRRIVRRGQAFMQPDLAALRVVEDEIGEGAADVEADAVAQARAGCVGHDACRPWCERR